MTDTKKQPDQQGALEQPAELQDEALDQAAGGAARSGGDDDLDDLEVERFRRR